MKIETIEKYIKFDKKIMLPKLVNLFYNCLLHELTDSFHLRCKPVRNADCIIRCTIKDAIKIKN